VRPVLLDLGGVELGSYGVSKLLAALAAGFLLARELGRRELDSGLAYPLTLAAGVGGFVGAKLYYLAEHADSLAAHDFGGSGFTWFGGLLGGGVAVLLVARAQEGHGHRQPRSGTRWRNSGQHDRDAARREEGYRARDDGGHDRAAEEEAAVHDDGWPAGAGRAG